MRKNLLDFLTNSLTAYHARDNEKAFLLQNGFTCLSETEDWTIEENGKYFVARGGALIAFTVGDLSDFCYKIAAVHNDSPALKIKENPVIIAEGCAKLNVETYGGGIWHTFMDRPLKIAGQVIKKQDGALRAETITSQITAHIPSVAIHQNRSVNDGVAINPQVDLQPIIGLSNNNSAEEWMQKITGDNVISYDLFVVSGETPYLFGANEEFLASARIDNLTCAHALLQAVADHQNSGGICVAGFLNCEETGSLALDGADGDFLQNVLRRIAYALRFDDNEYYKALASSFLLSADNAHAAHPNHPEKCDPTNRTHLGKGVVIKSHAGGAYITQGISSAVVQTVFENAEVPFQHFYNRSDMRSGGTLGAISSRHISVRGADIGIAQLAMHSACECIALADYDSMQKGIAAYFSSNIHILDDKIQIE